MSRRLDRMRANPAGDWTIADIEAPCHEYGVRCIPPRGGGSHYKVSHTSRHDIFTIPGRRPIKAIYIRKLVRFIEGVAREAKDGGP